MHEGVHSVVFGLLVCCHFLTAKLGVRPRLQWRRQSFDTTWTEASIPFTASPTGCLEVVKKPLAQSGSGWPRRAQEESSWSPAPQCRSGLLWGAGFWSPAINFFLVTSVPLNLGFHEKCWCGGVSYGSLTSYNPCFFICKVQIKRTALDITSEDGHRFLLQCCS